jgi:trehalose synthase
LGTRLANRIELHGSAALYEVQISPKPIELFADLIGPERAADLERRADILRTMLAGRVVWNVSSTSAGGGVAEMLRSIVRYTRGVGIDARWLVVEGEPEFFCVTKRIHNALHGSCGDRSPLGPEEAGLYERTIEKSRRALETRVRPGDVVICHDPQTAGLVHPMMRLGAKVIWRCHVGHEGPDNEEVCRGWAFLRPYVEGVPHAVFTRPGFAPQWLHKHEVVLPPSFDPFSTKNRPMAEEAIQAILVDAGLLDGQGIPSAPVYERDDGTTGRVDRKVKTLSCAKPAWDTRLVVQVSRWDAIKDPLGVLEGFAHHFVPKAPQTAHLVLAGPDLHSIADDPEGAKVFAAVKAAWQALPEALQRRVHVALLPMEDVEENAAIVNALQRHAAVIAQKSLQEGFGLTVTEAMWKGRPIVASAVGGIHDQIRDGIDGVLLHTPADPAEFAAALRRVLADDAFAVRLGKAAHTRVVDNYLPASAIARFADLVNEVVA